ncbi:MAG: hypothetical protein P8166_04380 [Candidatus Thiodiazotropha sp.]
MSDFELTGSLQGLKLLETSDLQQYKTAITNGFQMGFAYYFPHILSHNRPGRSAMLFEKIEESICIYRWKLDDKIQKLDIFAAPAPMSESALRICLERANDHNRNYSARILKIDEKDHEKIATLSAVDLKRWKVQYLYSPKLFADLRGGKFRTLRRNIAKINTHDNVEVVPYSSDHREACLSLLRVWRKHHQTTYKSNGAVGYTKRLFELANVLDRPDVLGEVIFIDDKLSAFSFGGEIRPGYGAFLEAKCDPNIPGLSYFQRHSFLSKLSDFELINDGSDLRREGLAQLKNSLRPIEMHTEYRGVEVSDLAHYQKALEQGAQMGWGYYFPFVMTKNHPGRTLALSVEDEDSICLFLIQYGEKKPRIDLLLAPTPMNKEVLIRCMERANDFNHDYSARILRIDDNDSKAVIDAGLRVRERKRQYIFSSGNYNDLGGSKYYTIRRNVSLVEKLPDIEVKAYTKSHLKGCRELLKRWSKLHRARHGTAGGAGTSRSILDLAGSLPASVLRGQVVYIDGRLVAFTFGGDIRPGLACSFERKCDNEVRGLSYFQLRNFLCSFDDGTLINDGSDAGSLGLRQLKDGFRPVLMHSEYRGSQRRVKG